MTLTLRRNCGLLRPIKPRVTRIVVETGSAGTVAAIVGAGTAAASLNRRVAFTAAAAGVATASVAADNRGVWAFDVWADGVWTDTAWE